MKHDERPAELPEFAVDARELLRHHLAALAFRFRHAVDDVPRDFATFDAGHGVRTPLDLVRHVAEVLNLGCTTLAGEGVEPNGFDVHDDAWTEAIDAVHAALGRLDVIVGDPAWIQADPERIRRTLHGPLVDAGTHIGQLLLLRRLAGSPAGRVSYLRADIGA